MSYGSLAVRSLKRDGAHRNRPLYRVRAARGCAGTAPSLLCCCLRPAQCHGMLRHPAAESHWWLVAPPQEANTLATYLEGTSLAESPMLTTMTVRRSVSTLQRGCDAPTFAPAPSRARRTLQAEALRWPHAPPPPRLQVPRSLVASGPPLPSSLGGASTDMDIGGTSFVGGVSFGSMPPPGSSMERR